MTNDLRERIAFTLWRNDAVRAAPNIVKYRTPEAFKGELDETRRIWLHHAAALIAAFPELQGWQPMETAPKGGTPILLWADAGGWRGNFARVCGAYHHGQWRIYGPTIGEPSTDGKTRQWLGEVYADHWMPLPTPPQEDQTDD